MGKMQRNKGAAFERAVANDLGIKRKIGQSRDGGNDLDLPPYTIECKRYAKFQIKRAWMQQALDACTDDRPVPVLVVRGDHDEAFVVMRFTDWKALAVGSTNANDPPAQS
jgi:hypothetical protein